MYVCMYCVCIRVGRRVWLGLGGAPALMAGDFRRHLYMHTGCRSCAHRRRRHPVAAGTGTRWHSENSRGTLDDNRRFPPPRGGDKSPAVNYHLPRETTTR